MLFLWIMAICASVRVANRAILAAFGLNRVYYGRYDVLFILQRLNYFAVHGAGSDVEIRHAPVLSDTMISVLCL